VPSTSIEVMTFCPNSGDDVRLLLRRCAGLVGEPLNLSLPHNSRASQPTLTRVFYCPTTLHGRHHGGHFRSQRNQSATSRAPRACEKNSLGRDRRRFAPSPQRARPPFPEEWSAVYFRLVAASLLPGPSGAGRHPGRPGARKARRTRDYFHDGALGNPPTAFCGPIRLACSRKSRAATAAISPTSPSPEHPVPLAHHRVAARDYGVARLRRALAEKAPAATWSAT